MSNTIGKALFARHWILLMWYKMIAEPLKLTYLVDREVVNTRTASTLLTSLIIFITSAFTTAGLYLVILSAGTMWIQLLLTIFLALLLLANAQILRLAAICTIGIGNATIYPKAPIVDYFPSIAVVIPCKNEHADILKRGIDSVRNACYSGRLKIYIADDSMDGHYRGLANELKVEYIAHPNPKINGKAGNLNYALQHGIDKDTELFFPMDCDYIITDKNIFENMVRLINCDEKTALVQAPQRYINDYSASRASLFAETENKVWFDKINASAARYGIVPYHGTNSIVKVSALKDVGWLDTKSCLDDFPTFARMMEKGWKSAYLPFIVMEGEAPHDIAGLLRQRKKWATGMGRTFINDSWKFVGKAFLLRLLLFFIALSLLYPILQDTTNWPKYWSSILPIFILGPILLILDIVLWSSHIEESIITLHNWCNYMWFSWPLTNLCYSMFLSSFIILEYLGIFIIPMQMTVVLINFFASILLLPLIGGRKDYRNYLVMLSMDYLLTYEYGWNFIRGMFGARADVLTPKEKLQTSGSEKARLAVPILTTSAFFTALFFFLAMFLAYTVQQIFYIAFTAYNAIMYAYSINNIRNVSH